MLDSFDGAIPRGDSAAVRPRLTADLVWTGSGSGAEVDKSQRLAAKGPRPAIRPRFGSDNVRFYRRGDAALVSFRRVDRRVLGGYESMARWRVLDVFAWLGGPVALRALGADLDRVSGCLVALASGAQQAVVGRYAMAPSTITACTRWPVGSWPASSDPHLRLAFCEWCERVQTDSTGALITFKRDVAGRVTCYVQGYPDGSCGARSSCKDGSAPAPPHSHASNHRPALSLGGR